MKKIFEQERTAISPAKSQIGKLVSETVIGAKVVFVGTSAELRQELKLDDVRAPSKYFTHEDHTDLSDEEIYGEQSELDND